MLPVDEVMARIKDINGHLPQVQFCKRSKHRHEGHTLHRVSNSNFS
jgi:hypothetical protein